MRVLLLCLAASWTLAGCASKVLPSSAAADAGSINRTDAGAPGPATGPGGEDGGSAVPDAGPGEPDAGSPGPDAGPAPSDAGTLPDAGPPPPPDAGVVPVDLGETGWTQMLDGSLSWFYRWLPSKGRNSDPEGVFRMEGDLLHILGLPPSDKEKDFGYLATWEEFHDYRLRVEQRWGTNTFPPRKGQPRDSGLLYHLRRPDEVWPQCVEFQIMEHDTGDLWMLSGTGVTTTVADVHASPPTFDPLGQEVTLRGGRLVKSEDPESLTGWNSLELIASGRDSAQVVNGRWVNGARAIEDDGWNELRQGRIALQAEGAEVYYRNMMIRPLVYMPPPPGAVVLFDGWNLDAWESSGNSAPRWRLVDGAMEVAPGTGDLHSRRWFGDVRLHVEFQVPPSAPGAAEQDRGNSGVYIQGHYEVQVLDSFGATLSGANDCGAIYGVKNAEVNESFPPGIWQSYDILFRAPRWSGSTKVSPARITVVWNGTKVQQDVEVWGSTTLGDPEIPGESDGPLRLQDHGHPVRFRNIWVQPL